MIRITIKLSADERDALDTLARAERRDPREQAAFLIRYALVQHGVLATVEPQPVLTAVEEVNSAGYKQDRD